LTHDWLAFARLKHQAGEPVAAAAAYREALAAQPLPALRGLAHLAAEAHDYGAAVAWFKRACALAPHDRTLTLDLALALDLSGASADALAIYRDVLASDPANLRALENHAALLRDGGELDAALADYTTLTRLAPGAARYWSVYAECLRRLERFDDAIDACDRALAIAPQLIPALMCKATALALAGRIAPSQAAYNRAFEIDYTAAAHYGQRGRPMPGPPDARAVHLSGAFARLYDAEWDAYAALVEAATAAYANVEHAPGAIELAFPLLYLPLPNARKSAGHRAVTRDLEPLAALPLLPGPRTRERLRIGYLGSKFGDHPGMRLVKGLFAAHDRARCEVFGYALNASDGGAIRAAAAQEFDLFRDLSQLDDEAALARVREDGPDLLVDLNGYSDGARPRILAARGAPLQVSYVGHSHSLFAPWIDYRITDDACEPDDWGMPLVEQPAFVPPSYYCYGSAPVAPLAAADRATLGLPADAFVLAALGRVEKIEPSAYACWLELLRRLPEAVLWLGPMNARAEHNLRARAAAAGLGNARLICAPRVPHPAHLARLAAADLYLDTWVFNAHTTALDALHAGLPVVSLKGRSWSARIGASLLTAAELPELIAETAQAYAETVIGLAHDRARLALLRRRLATTLATRAPFAPARLARRLEQVYAIAIERHRSAGVAGPIVIT